MSEKRKLPKEWRFVKLSEVAKVNPPRSRTIIRNENELTTFVQMSSVDEISGQVITYELKPFHVVKKGYTYFEESDVIFAKITPCMQNGKHAIVRNLEGGFGFGSTEFHVIRAQSEVAPEWIHYYVRQPHILESAQEHFKGAVGQQRVPPQWLENLEIPLPPLETQKRIAALLDEQMAAVARARKAAEEGLAAAQNLTTSYLQRTFQELEQLHPNKQMLGNVCEFQGGSQPPKSTFKSVPQDGYVRLVQIRDFRSSDYPVYIPEKFALRKFEKDDVMIGRYGPPVFQILRGLSGAYNVALMKAIPNEYVSKKFLYYLLQEPQIQHDVTAQSQRSAGQSGVEKDFLEKYRVVVPPLGVQEKTVATLEEGINGAMQLVKRLQGQLELLEAMPSALLRRAFSGEL